MAQKLGVKYYDKEMIGTDCGAVPDFHRSISRRMRNCHPRKGLFAYAFSGRDQMGRSVEDMIYEAQRKIILDIAEREECVIIGRNADFILKDRDDVLNVFIHGNMPEKVKRICGLYNVTEQEAIKMTEDIDKRRMSNYRFYTDQKWGMASNYTLSLNSSVLGYEMCERIIMECAGR